MSSRKRSFLKALTWRGVAFIVTMLVAYLLTGTVAIAIGVAVIDSIVKVVAYYFHERAWDRLGKKIM